MFLFTAEQYDRDHAALSVLLGLNGLRVSEACATNVKDLGVGVAIARCGSWARATSPPPCRSYPGEHARSTWPSVSATTGRSCGAVTANASTGAPPTGGSGRSGSVPGSRRSPAHAASRVHHGRARRGCPAARRPDRRPTRRPSHDHHLRPPPPELRPPRGVRRRCLRGRWMISAPASSGTLRVGDRGAIDRTRGSGIVAMYVVAMYSNSL